MKRKYIVRNTVVVYGNKIQTINLSNLNALEHNLLFSIFKNLRYSDEHTFTKEQIEIMSNNVSKNKNDLYKIIKSLPNKFLGTNILIENEKTKMFVNLFSYLKINNNDGNIDSISIGINKDFSYLFRDIKNNFMSFDLEVFKSFNSVYTKTIYRYLNQHNSSGIWSIKYKDFVELLNIPTTYNFSLINYRIIKPSIKSLSKYIKNLKYEVIRKRTNGVLLPDTLIFKFEKYQNVIKGGFEAIQVDRKLKRTLFGFNIVDNELNSIINKMIDNNGDPSLLEESQKQLTKIKINLQYNKGEK